MLPSRSLKEEVARRFLQIVYKKYPMYWLKHRFKEDPKAFQWTGYAEYKKHSFDGDRDPLYHAWQSLAEGNWVALFAATATSKTYMLARIIMWYLDVFHNGLVVITAPKQDQLEHHLWGELSKLYSKMHELYNSMTTKHLCIEIEHAYKNVGNPESDKDCNTVSKAVGFVSGIKAGEESATKAQGFHAKHMLYVIDETPGVHPAVMNAIENTSVGRHNLIIAVGNPESDIDTLSNFSKHPRVKKFTVSAYDYPNVVCKRDIYNGAVTQISIDSRKIKYGESSRLFLSRVRGLVPTVGKDSMFDVNWVDESITVTYAEDDKYFSTNAMGVDVSNSEHGDKAAVCVGSSSTVTFLKEFTCPNATHLAYNLCYATDALLRKGYKNYSLPTFEESKVATEHIGVDSVGVGAATVNAFYDLGYHILSINGGQDTNFIEKNAQGDLLYEFTSIRAQVYWMLREDLRTGRIKIMDSLNKDIITGLKQELSATVFKISSNKIALESKDVIKKKLAGKSPNLADAMAYWNYARQRKSVEIDLPIFA